ncbi:MAG TPA: 3-methyl-2-oxobutanoate dehydrogenase subunit beta [Clostridiales bacterium]|nr:3-methyl-2-oxobutanoate dehydrogenase subunit beta [Clostridiales bacterium]
MGKILMKGNEAVGAAAIAAGIDSYFAYPITPQNEISEYLSRELPKSGKAFLQAESEIAAINMVYGASASGVRAMTSSSGPGIALMQEGISYCAGSELPCVILNMMRGGPGLGSILPAQADYFQATKGGGNGDYRNLVYAPSNVQELFDLVVLAFDKADQYRNPVIVLADGVIGQMMEPVDVDKELRTEKYEKQWALTGTYGRRDKNIISSFRLQAEDMEKHNKHLLSKYKEMLKNEKQYETLGVEDADIVITGYGSSYRICKSAKELLEAKDIKVGLIRPITLWPFPDEAYANITSKCKFILDVEMNFSQMVDDIKVATNCKLPIFHYGRYGGVIPSEEEIVEEVERIIREEIK